MMFCQKCGSPLIPGSLFCEKCGARVPQDAALQPTVVSPPPAYPPPSDNSQTVYQPQDSFQRTDNPYGQPPPQPRYYQETVSYADDGGKKGGGVIVAVLIVLTILVLGLCGAVIYLVASNNKDSGSKKSSSSEAATRAEAGEEEVTSADGHNEGAITPGEIATEPATPEPDDDSYEGVAKRTSDRKKVNINYVSSDVSDYPNVKLYFTAEDDAGQPVQLSSPNAAVKERVKGGAEAERKIKCVEQLKGKEGVSFDIVADKSGSMSGDMRTMQNVMTQFVEALDYRSGDRAELIAFDSYVMYMCTYTSDVNLLKNGISNMEPYGETALYDALYEGVINAGAQKGARCVIGFTDGSDNRSVHSAREVINAANLYSVPIFIIGTRGASNYDDIASSTGGEYWNVSNVGDMSGVLEQIYDQQKDMYCLEYVSDGSADRYAEREVGLAIEDGVYGSITEITFTPTETAKPQAHSSRYEVVKADITWEEANAECIKRGGHLVTITSEDEMNKVSKLAQDADLKYVWIGGYTSIRGSNAFGHWITGEPFNYQSWYPGEPSRNDKDGVQEMYLMLWFVDNKWSWNDQRNDVCNIPGLTYFKGKTGYICEYEN